MARARDGAAHALARIVVAIAGRMGAGDGRSSNPRSWRDSAGTRENRAACVRRAHDLRADHPNGSRALPFRIGLRFAERQQTARGTRTHATATWTHVPSDPGSVGVAANS